MPVRVEATLNPSRLRWIVLVGITGLASAVTFVFSHSFVLALAWIIVPWLVSHSWRCETEFNRIRFDGSDIRFWDSQNDCYEFVWQGQGRASSFFLVFDLMDTEGLRLQFLIWRDSVSDASWRALNMAFHVEQPAQSRNQKASD